MGGIEAPGTLGGTRFPSVIVPVCVVSTCVYTSVAKCVLQCTHSGSARACVRATPCAKETPCVEETPCVSGVVTSVPGCVLPSTPCVKGAPLVSGAACVQETARVCEQPCGSEAQCVSETPRVSAPACVSVMVCVSETARVSERPSVRKTACIYILLRISARPACDRLRNSNRDRVAHRNGQFSRDPPGTTPGASHGWVFRPHHNRANQPPVQDRVVRQIRPT